MKNTALIALLLASVAFPALATGRGDGPSNSNGPRGGNATASAGAQAGAIAGARASNRTTVTTRATGGRATATGGSAQATGTQTTTVTVAGASAAPVGGTTTIRTAPEVAAPAIWSNNPCIISASGSVSVVGFGASLGAGVEDADCTRRANAQLLAAMGQPDAAREVMCANREVREAFRRTGRPCAADQGAPTPQVPAPTLRTAAAPITTTAPRPAFCSVPGLNVASYPECR